MNFQHDFSTTLSFLIPKLIKKTDEKGNEVEVPYGPIRYKKILEECYLISHQIHTSYTDVLKISPTEREGLLKLIQTELKMQKEQADKLKAESENRRKNK